MNLIGPQQFSLVILGQHRHLHSLMHNMGLRLAQDPVGCAGNIGVFLGEISTLSPKTKTSEISPDSLSWTFFETGGHGLRATKIKNVVGTASIV